MAYVGDDDGKAHAPASVGGGAGDSLIGRVIGGNFRIVKLIGSGAMGTVYQAEQRSLAKMVAIKVLREDLKGDENLIKRFELEAKNASSLNHPNSIQIIDFGRDDDLLFIAMELLPGVDLGQIVAREGALPLARAGRIIDQVLGALDEAHAQSIIHRDLKPGNIMVVSRRGEPDYVKVCDFGIAKCQAGGRDGPNLTVKGLVCGTPEYMSPEQARAEEVDGRADIYAVGVIFYQLLTGELPYTAGSTVELLSKHLSEAPVRPSRRRPDVKVPREIEDLVLRALAKRREDRPQTAADMQADLRRALAASIEGWRTPVTPMPMAVAPFTYGPGTPGARAGGTTPLVSSQTPTPRRGVAPVDAAVAAGRPRRRATLLGLLGTAALVVAGGLAWLSVRDDSGSGPAPQPAALAAQAHVGVGSAPAAPPSAPLAVGAETPPRQPAPATPPAADPAAAPAPSPAPAAAQPEAPPEVQAAPTKPVRRTAAPRAPAPRALAKAASAQPSTASANAASTAASPAPPSPPPATAPAATPSSAANPPAALQEPPSAAAPTASDLLKEAERLLGQGEVSAACKKAEESRRMSPQHAPIYKFLGKCYMRSGEPSRARERYAKYLELAPDANDAAFIKSIVK